MSSTTHRLLSVLAMLTAAACGGAGPSEDESLGAASDAISTCTAPTSLSATLVSRTCVLFNPDGTCGINGYKNKYKVVASGVPANATVDYEVCQLSNFFGPGDPTDCVKDDDSIYDWFGSVFTTCNGAASCNASLNDTVPAGIAQVRFRASLSGGTPCWVYTGHIYP